MGVIDVRNRPKVVGGDRRDRLNVCREVVGWEVWGFMRWWRVEYGVVGGVDV